MQSAPLINEPVLDFARRCENAQSLRDLEPVWRNHMRKLGFVFAALGGHVDPLHPDRISYVFCDYPEEWLIRYSDRRYHLIDPVYRAVESGYSDFDWNDPDFYDTLAWRQRRILAEAREFGLRFGRTHALAPTLYLAASSSLVTESVDLDPAAYATAKLANVITHHRAAQLCAPKRPGEPELRPRERQCLQLCARGRTDAEIGRELGISLATVRRHIESARLRLGVSSRVQAALRALQSGQIEP